MNAPSDRAQLAFLKQLQRIFNEGEFVATYKFALLHAIADICVERADDAKGRLHIPIQDLGAKFLELYWNHAAPYNGNVILQNTHGQAEIVRKLEQARLEHRTLPAFRNSAQWARSVKSAASLIRKMPLWRLQTLGEQPHEFLYANKEVDGGILLLPGVAHCLRTFYPLVLNLVREHWVSHLRAINSNQAFLGRQGDLESFLFATQRSALPKAADVLIEIQSGKCFYCGRIMSGDWHVDHFIPWARYPRDLAHNFVLAHDRCNMAKRDTLAARPHVERWLERNAAQGRNLVDGLSTTFLCDEQASQRVAQWSYALDSESDARLWIKGKEYVPFDRAILSLL